MNHRLCIITAVLAAVLAAYVIYDVGQIRARTAIVESCNRQRSFYADSQTFKCLPVVPRITNKEWQ